MQQVNASQGEIEKTGELIDIERPSPPKKRRKAKVEKASDAEVVREAEAAAKPKKKKKRSMEEGAGCERPRPKRVKKKTEKAAVLDEQVQSTAGDGPSSSDAAPAPNGTNAGEHLLHN